MNKLIYRNEIEENILIFQAYHPKNILSRKNNLTNAAKLFENLQYKFLRKRLLKMSISSGF